MSGLYHRALEVYRQTVGLRLVAQGEQGPDIEEISPEERGEVLRQINEVVDRNRIKLEPGTFAIAAKRSGSGLPILINAIAIAALIVTLFTFSWLFNRRQVVIVSGSGTILTAENKLIEARGAAVEERLAAHCVDRSCPECNQDQNSHGPPYNRGA
jgi:hypothetical protein